MSKILSVIVPVFNEEKHLDTLVPFLLHSPCPLQREWIFVDDGSNDSSYSLLAKMQPSLGFKLIQQKPNRGKGAAIRRGLLEVTGDIVLIQDADFEVDPQDVPALLEPIIQDESDVVYGSRFKKNNPQIRRTYHYLANRLLTMLSNLCSGIYLTDMETCYKVMRSDLLRSMNLRSQRFGIEIEITAYLSKTVARIQELPIRYSPRNRRLGKKIGWRDGVAAFVHLIRFNFLTSAKGAFTNLPDQYLPKD